MTGKHETTTQRTSDQVLTVTRIFEAPAQKVFAAWTDAELMKRWWAPASFCVTIQSCQIDARAGGGYRFVMSHPSAPGPMEFFGRYLEVTAPSKIVWTNEEGEDGGALTTVTFSEADGVTTLVLSDLYPSKEALDEAIASQATDGFPEQFRQLDALLEA